MTRTSSLSERPGHHGPRRLVHWLNPAGERKVHSLVDKDRAGSFLEPSMRHLCESGLRENRTSRLSGGRRPAPRGASSDPTPVRSGNSPQGTRRREAADRMMELAEGKMTGTLGREVISTRQRKIAELARREPKLTLWGHLRSFLDRRVRDGVHSVYR